MRPVKRVHGQAVCLTVLDGRGHAHLADPDRLEHTVCGRALEISALRPKGTSCGECSKGAPDANLRLRRRIVCPLSGQSTVIWVGSRPLVLT